MTDITPLERALKIPELMEKADVQFEPGHQRGWRYDLIVIITPELATTILIAAATMMVLEKGGRIAYPYVWINKYSFRFFVDDPASYLTALQDALEAEDE